MNEERSPTPPGAMTVAMRAVGAAASRVLRVGVVRGGRIEAEHTLREGESLTAGPSGRSQLVVPELAEDVRLLRVERGRAVLRVLPGTRAKLRGTRAQVSLDGVAAGAELVLPEGVRGRVEIGQVALLLKETFAAPRARPALAVKSGFFRNLDWTFTAFVVTSFAAHLALVVALDEADWSVPSVAEIPAEFHQFLIEETPPPPDDSPPAPDLVTEIADAHDVVAPQVTHRPSQPTRTPRADAPRTPMSDEALHALEAHVQQQLHTMLTGASPGPSPFTGLTHPPIALDDVFAPTLGPASPEDPLRPRDGSDFANPGAPLGLLATLGATAQNAVEGGPIEESERTLIRRRPPVIEDPLEPPGGTCDSERVLRAVRARLASITACHTAAIRRAPGTSGKLSVSFTIQASNGTVSRASIEEDTVRDPVMASCVLSAVRTVRFREMCDEGTSTYTFPFVFQAQR